MQIDAQLKALLPHHDDWQLLGEGGFGQTWRARDTLQEEHVVVKTRPLTEAAERAVTRKAELMSRLHNEGLQRFYSVMKTAETLVLIYAYEDGCSLAPHLKEQGALPQDKALAIIEQLLAAVDVIHAADFIHRDVIPHNVILRSDGTRC